MNVTFQKKRFLDIFRSYQERYNLLKNNSVLAARYFYYKIEVFFKEIILIGPLGKTKHYAIRIEFQERSSTHIRSCIWIFTAPNIQEKFRTCCKIQQK